MLTLVKSNKNKPIAIINKQAGQSSPCLLSGFNYQHEALGLFITLHNYFHDPQNPSHTSEHSHILNSDHSIYDPLYGSMYKNKNENEKTQTSLSLIGDVFIFVIKGTLQLSKEHSTSVYLTDVCLKENKTAIVETISAGECVVIPNAVNKTTGIQWQQAPDTCFLTVKYQPPEHSNQDNSENEKENINEATDVIRIAQSTKKNDPGFSNTSDGYQKKECFVTANKQFSSGIWASKSLATGLAEYPDNEFLLINQGCLICIDEHDNEQVFTQGDALFIPQGSFCAWRVEESVTITYAKIKGLIL